LRVERNTFELLTARLFKPRRFPSLVKQGNALTDVDETLEDHAGSNPEDPHGIGKSAKLTEAEEG